MWIEAFKAYQEMDIIRIVELEEQSEFKPPIFNITQILGEHEKACLARLQKIINELPSNTDGKSVVYSEN